MFHFLILNLLPCKAVQWNIKSCLILLIPDRILDVIYLHETLNIQNTEMVLQIYKSYFYNSYNSAIQGIGILIKQHISHTVEQIETFCQYGFALSCIIKHIHTYHLRTKYLPKSSKLFFKTHTQSH